MSASVQDKLSSLATGTDAVSGLQAGLPVEKQIMRWREEVYKLLLSNKQAQASFDAQTAAHLQAQSRLEQQVASADAKALLLEGRLADRQVSCHTSIVQCCSQ